MYRDRAWIELNTDNLAHNLALLRRTLPDRCRVMGIVKANAYGHGLAPVAGRLAEAGVEDFGVATVDEGLALREMGVRGRILVLGPTEPGRAWTCARAGLELTVASAQHAGALLNTGAPLTVQLKIDSSMHRLGLPHHDTDAVARLLTDGRWRVSGIYTHLCVADGRDRESGEFTRGQIGKFYALLDRLARRGIRVPEHHIQSSYGVLNYPDLRCDLARPGIALYGCLSAPGDETVVPAADLRPVLALRARVAVLRRLRRGEAMGYGLEHRADRDQRIAVLPVGYADGYPRSLSDGAGRVLIHGKVAPVAGRICMDQMMVDVTDIPGVQVGDRATLIGRDGPGEIRAEEVAGWCGTITNELLSRLGGRLDRVPVSGAGAADRRDDIA